MGHIRGHRGLVTPVRLGVDHRVDALVERRHLGLQPSGKEKVAGTFSPVWSADTISFTLRPSGWSGAYGLTPDEVRLMWATAPPRMPLMPKDDAPDQAESAAAE